VGDPAGYVQQVHDAGGIVLETAGSAEGPAMEYLITMTTRVPDGTADEIVADVRAREAAHTRELAANGHVLRLWRPPLAPGEWRTLGLFAAADRVALERILASMPLRIWRADEVTELTRHPNDPDGPGPGQAPATEFFTTFRSEIPDDTPARVVAEARAGEARRTHELAEQGHLIRLWRLPASRGGPVALGLWRAPDAARMRAILDSLPEAPWLSEQITPLEPHPSDPAVAGSREPTAQARS
jgi:muconolactone delta-isomerase